MKKIIFCDKNKILVSKVRKALKYFPKKVEVIEGDIFKHKGVIVSASNPDFSMGGGLDALIAKKYPKEAKEILKYKKNKRIGNVVFTITVDSNLVASRELVKSALDFALKNTKQGETVLISGLGTGIGGLDPDDFVWILLASLSKHFKYGWGIKFVKKNGTDFYTGKIKYQTGKHLTQAGAKKDGKDCGVGLHLGKSFVGAGNYCLPEKILFCVFDRKDKCGEGTDKIRVRKLLPVYIVPRWLGYGENGKEILRKIDKKIDPEKYNLYQATKLPALKKIATLFKSQVWYQVRDQVENQVGYQVGKKMENQVWYQVWNQVKNKVRYKVWDQVWEEVKNQLENQVENQVWDQVWDQVRATSCWAINLHFNLGISHWFGDFIKLGVMVVFADGKLKVFGKKGKFLGEYEEKEFIRLQNEEK